MRCLSCVIVFVGFLVWIVGSGVARGDGDVTGCEVEPNDLVAFSAPQVEIAEFGSQ